MEINSENNFLIHLARHQVVLLFRQQIFAESLRNLQMVFRVSAEFSFSFSSENQRENCSINWIFYFLFWQILRPREVSFLIIWLNARTYANSFCWDPWNKYFKHLLFSAIFFFFLHSLWWIPSLKCHECTWPWGPASLSAKE